MPNILTPEDIATLEGDIFRNKYPQSERDKMDESVFCGPNKSFPIKDSEDVIHAAERLGEAKGDQSSIKACVIGKAKANGWPLPKTWEEDNDEEKERMQSPTIIRADGTHDAMTGKHSHAHPAFGSQGDDGTHEHEHEHTDDASHDHPHADVQNADVPDILRSMPSETSFYLPITRIDREKREVVVRATAEVKDGFGTVFSYDGSKEAFGNWRGNIREMHDPTKAVGRALQIIPSDEEKAIDLVLRVSKGAQDTWEKVLDGTLSGASVGAKNGKWTKKIMNGEEVPFLERYNLVEVSLVDNPATPSCDIKIVRSDGFINQDVLDNDDESEETRTQVPTETRVGARVSGDTKAKMHATRDAMATALRGHLDNCACDECSGIANVLDPDGDGDIDVIPSLDTDQDYAGASGDGSGTGDVRALRETIARIIQEEIFRQTNPLILRLNGIASRFAQVPQVSQSQQTPDITRRLDGLEQKLNGLTEVHSLLKEVKELTKLIAEQPQQAQPYLRALQPDVQNQNQPPARTPAQELMELARNGQLNRNQQVNLAAQLLQGRQ